MSTLPAKYLRPALNLSDDFCQFCAGFFQLGINIHAYDIQAFRRGKVEFLNSEEHTAEGTLMDITADAKTYNMVSDFIV